MKQERLEETRAAFFDCGRFWFGCWRQVSADTFAKQVSRDDNILLSERDLSSLDPRLYEGLWKPSVFRS